jgi:hypothetical protein
MAPANSCRRSPCRPGCNRACRGERRRSRRPSVSRATPGVAHAAAHRLEDAPCTRRRSAWSVFRSSPARASTGRWSACRPLVSRQRAPPMVPRQVDQPALVGGLGRALGHRNFEPGEELPDVAAQHRGKRTAGTPPAGSRPFRTCEPAGRSRQSGPRGPAETHPRQRAAHAGERRRDGRRPEPIHVQAAGAASSIGQISDPAPFARAGAGPYWRASAPPAWTLPRVVEEL